MLKGSENLPLVYVVILNWKSSQDTIECVKSVQKSNYPNYKILLIDNGSSDDSEKILRAQFPNLELIQTGKNLGYSGGNNVGIRYALERRCDYIFILNSDTVIDKITISELVNYASQNPKAGIVSPVICNYSDPQTVAFGPVYWDVALATFVHPFCGKQVSEISKNELEETGFLEGSALFFTQNVPREVGLFDEAFFLLWEDSDWCVRTKKRGFQILQINSTCVWHKGSCSFKNRPAWHYDYYFSRNRLLWIKKNLKGREKILAYKRCLKEIYWGVLSLVFQKPNERERITAKMSGMRDYLLCHFGRTV